MAQLKWFTEDFFMLHDVIRHIPDTIRQFTLDDPKSSNLIGSLPFSKSVLSTATKMTDPALNCINVRAHRAHCFRALHMIVFGT